MLGGCSIVILFCMGIYLLMLALMYIYGVFLMGHVSDINAFNITFKCTCLCLGFAIYCLSFVAAIDVIARKRDDVKKNS